MIESTASLSNLPAYAIDRNVRSGSSDATGKASGSRSDSSATKQVKALTPEQQRQVQQLKETDRKVRAHEQAHLSVGADLVRGGATFTYQTGPDDQRYAVGGEVSIDVSPGRTPEETIPKAQHIRATALAPVDPSAQDQSVAAEAGLMEANARTEVSANKQGQTVVASGAALSNRSGAGFYQAVAQSNGSAATAGVGVNSFA